MDQLQSPPKRVVIIAGGEIAGSIHIGAGDYVIAADSGYDIARDQNVHVDLLVGDLDSISSRGLTHAEASDVVIERFPESKEKTDFELALDAAIALGAKAVDVYGGEGGSFGHLLGISTGLTARTWDRIDLRWFMGSDTVIPVQPKHPLEVSLPVGTRLTLVPIGDADNVTTNGLKWPLSSEPLPRGTSRGLSNITTDPVCTVSLTRGALLVIVDGGDPV